MFHYGLATIVFEEIIPYFNLLLSRFSQCVFIFQVFSEHFITHQGSYV